MSIEATAVPRLRFFMTVCSGSSHFGRLDLFDALVVIPGDPLCHSIVGLGRVRHAQNYSEMFVSASST